MSSIVDINTSEARVNLDRPKLTQNSASNNAYSFPMNIPANFISTDKSKDSHISSLEKQLAEAKESYLKLETKNDEQSHIIVSMKQMISKTIQSEDQYLKIAIKKNVSNIILNFSGKIIRKIEHLQKGYGNTTKRRLSL